MRQVQRLVDVVKREAGRLGDVIADGAVELRVDISGTPFVDVNGYMIEDSTRWAQLVGRPLVVDLLATFSVDEHLVGPNLRHPRAHLRIIPGKLSGEPHVEDTRVETRVLAALAHRGLSSRDLAKLYPDLPVVSIENALDLEQQLDRNLRAA